MKTLHFHSFPHRASGRLLHEVHEFLKLAHRGDGFAVNDLCRRMHLHPLTFKK